MRMKTIVCSDILTFIYGQAVEGLQVEELILVQILPDDWSGSPRPFAEKIKLARAIADFYEIRFTFYLLDNRFEVLSHLSSEVLVDISVVRYLNINKRAQNRCQIISIAPEHVALKDPSLLKGITPSFKRRIMFIRNVILKYRIFSLYNLRLTNSRTYFIKERSINLHLSLARTQSIYDHLKKIGFNSAIPDQKFDEAIFVFLLAENFGGTLKFNLELINLAKIFALDKGIGTIIIKNHPADASKYSVCLGLTSKDINFIFWETSSMRMIPLEILVNCADKFTFMGMYSTMMLTHSELVHHKTTVVLPKDDVEGCVWDDYHLGTILKLFDHHLIRI